MSCTTIRHVKLPISLRDTWIMCTCEVRTPILIRAKTAPLETGVKKEIYSTRPQFCMELTVQISFPHYFSGFVSSISVQLSSPAFQSSFSVQLFSPAFQSSFSFSVRAACMDAKGRKFDMPLLKPSCIYQEAIIILFAMG